MTGLDVCFGLALLALVVAGIGCRSGATVQSSDPRECVTDPARAAQIHFERSPGGVLEVDAGWLHDDYCNVRVVDVREAAELRGPLGGLPFAEHVPLDRLGEESSAWDPDEPIVLICRSGRRSARGARLLEDMGFTRAASLSGGMLVWNERHHVDPSYEVTRPATEPPGVFEPAETSLLETEPDPNALIDRLRDIDQIHWVKVAGLLLQGTESCVDGRDPRPVVGTPGGDAGELLLALAALEQVRGEEIEPARVGAILDAFLDAFGRFYIHTDTHALEELGESLRARLPASRAHLPDGDLDAVEMFLRNPPHAMEPAILDALVSPEHVGCGHLRLVLLHPEEYGVRRQLAETLLREVFVRLWRGDPIDFVVLEGEHHEGAVVNVLLDREIHPFTRIPTAPPRLGSTDLFINHPQVSAWLREQNASFFFEIDPWLHEAPDRRTAFLETLSEMGDAQLAATLGHLAPDIPVYEAHVSEQEIRVVGPVSQRGRP